MLLIEAGACGAGGTMRSHSRAAVLRVSVIIATTAAPVRMDKSFDENDGVEGHRLSSHIPKAIPGIW